jgi:hypothetical protein
VNTVITHRNRWALLAALVAPLCLCAVLVPFRATFTNAAAAVLLIAVVVAVAVAGRRFAGIVATVSSALWFDFFLTVPYDRFEISHRNDIETMVCILVVGIIVTDWAARSRHHFQASNDTSGFVGMIHDLAALGAGSESVDAIIERAQTSIAELLELRSCRFEEQIADPPLARIGPQGEVLHVGLLWPVDNIGIPGPQAEILAQWRGHVVGRFVLTPTPGLPVSVERRMVATSLAELAAAALLESRPVG